MEPTLYVDEMGTAVGDPLRKAVQTIAFGAKIVPALLLDGKVEAEIAIVRSSPRALHFLKETENTMIGIFVFKKSEVEAATALANRYPERIRVMDWEEFGVSLLTLIAEKAKE